MPVLQTKLRKDENALQTIYANSTRVPTPTAYLAVIEAYAAADNAAHAEADTNLDEANPDKEPVDSSSRFRGMLEMIGELSRDHANSGGVTKTDPSFLDPATALLSVVQCMSRSTAAFRKAEDVRAPSFRATIIGNHTCTAVPLTS